MQLEVEAYSGTAGAVTMAQGGPQARASRKNGQEARTIIAYGQ
jgi:hypothetical protein